MERRNCGLPPAPCASQKQSSPPGPATSCHPSIHREVVRITDPGSSTMQDPATHTGPDGEDIPLSTLLQHCPPTPRPRHPASLYDLEGAKIQVPKSKWPGTWSAEAVRVTPDTPLQTFMRQKGAPGQKKNHDLQTWNWGAQRSNVHHRRALRS